MEQTIEQRVAAAILEKSIGNIEIDGVNYEIAPPSVATLIRISELISTLPIVKDTAKDDEERFYIAVHHAKYFKPLGEIAAVLILGAKKIEEEKVIYEKKPFLHFFNRRVKRTIKLNKHKELAEYILNYISPKILLELIIERIKDMEVSSFFVITTSLSEINLIKPTKEVD